MESAAGEPLDKEPRGVLGEDDQEEPVPDVRVEEDALKAQKGFRSYQPTTIRENQTNDEWVTDELN